MNKDYLTTEEAEEYYQTLRDAKAFQNCLGAMSIVLGLLIVILTGVGEGLLFTILGVYLIITKNNPNSSLRRNMITIPRIILIIPRQF